MAGGGGSRTAWRIAPWAAAGLVLLLPALAMRLTDEVAWDGADFAILCALLLGACAAFEGAARRTGSLAYRAAVGVAVVTALLLVWMTLAVGVIGSEDHPANGMLGLVLAVGLLGAVAARFRARGMARALAATALAQGLAGAAALAAGAGRPEAVAALTALFAVSWLASAWLFRKDARGTAG
jgi:hypothetical protein